MRLDDFFSGQPASRDLFGAARKAIEAIGPAEPGGVLAWKGVRLGVDA